MSEEMDFQDEYEDYEAYGEFADIYDELMDEIPYEDWHKYIVDELEASGISDGLVLDLGCGTGTLTEMLADSGYDMIGVDLSEDMLAKAMEKREKSGNNILYLCQDMREFELYGTVRAIVSVCDSLNYLLEEEDLLTVFKRANNYLDPGGLFIFDVNTTYRYKEIIGDKTIAENRDDCSFIWENYFDEETGINEYSLTLFILDPDERTYRKAEEQHYQRGYELKCIKQLIEESGMIFIKAFDTDRNCEVDENTQKFTVVAKEKGK